MKPPMILFGHQVTIRGYVANNSLGEKIYTNIAGIDASMIISSSPSGDVIIKARFEPSVSTDRQTTGEEKRYKATLFTLGTDIPPQSTVIFENSKYIVSECIKHYDLNNISYLEVLLS